MSGWSWFAIAWRLSGENAVNLEPTFRLHFLHNLSILAYLTDKAEADRLDQERAKLAR